MEITDYIDSPVIYERDDEMLCMNKPDGFLIIGYMQAYDAIQHKLMCTYEEAGILQDKIGNFIADCINNGLKPKTTALINGKKEFYDLNGVHLMDTLVTGCCGYCPKPNDNYCPVCGAKIRKEQGDG